MIKQINFIKDILSVTSKIEYPVKEETVLEIIELNRKLKNYQTLLEMREEHLKKIFRTKIN